MPTLHIDAGTAINRLVEAGVPKAQATAIVDAFKDVDIQQVASRDDIHRLELQLIEMETRIIRWTVPLLLGQTAVFAGIVRWMG